MAGWLDELFNGAQFKGQDPKGLLEMLSQLAPPPMDAAAAEEARQAGAGRLAMQMRPNRPDPWGPRIDLLAKTDLSPLLGLFPSPSSAPQVPAPQVPAPQAAAQAAPAGLGFPAGFGGGGNYTTPFMSADQQAAQDAAEAAAERVRRGVKGEGHRRLDPFDVAQPGIDVYGQTDAFGMPKLSGTAPPAALPVDQPTPVQTVPGTVADRPIGGIPPDAQGAVGPAGAVAPVAAMAPPLGAAPFFPGQDVLARVGHHILQTLHDNSNSMIAGGGAMISGGLGHGLSAMAAASPLDIAARRERQGNQAIQATYDALIKAGHTPAEALAGSQNPEILKTLMEPKVLMGSKDAFGAQPAYVSKGGKLVPFEEAVSGAGGGGAAGGGPQPYAPGVKYNPNLVGDEYKAQFGPEVQSVMEAYRRGDIMPTGNPRLQGILPFAKIAATKWLNDIGEPMSDIDYNRKRNLQVDLTRSTPGSMGGILSNGASAFGHLATAAEKMVDLGNPTGSSIPGSGHLVSGYTYAGNVLAPSSDTKAKLKGIRDSLGKYGSEATKYYAGTGGGEAERMAAAKNNDPESSSGKEMAAFVETEKELMERRFLEKENQIRRELGDDWLKKHPIRDADFYATSKRLDTAIAQLKGEAKARPEPVRVQSVAEARKLPKCTPIILPDGSPGVVP